MDVDPKAVKAFVEELKGTYPSVIDPRRQVASPYRVWALPTTYFINRRGEIIGWFLGERDWDGEAARELIANLVSTGRPSVEGGISSNPKE